MHLLNIFLASFLPRQKNSYATGIHENCRKMATFRFRKHSLFALDELNARVEKIFGAGGVYLISCETRLRYLWRFRVFTNLTRMGNFPFSVFFVAVCLGTCARVLTIPMSAGVARRRCRSKWSGGVVSSGSRDRPPLCGHGDVVAVTA